MSTTPRRPLVPSPSTPGGLAERAIAVRERAAQPPEKSNGGQITPGLQALTSGQPVAVHHNVGHIAAAIANVMANVGTIEKGGTNKFFGYKYARMEDLLHVITPLMGKNGLAVIQNEVTKEVLEGNRLAVTYEFSIFHSSGEVWPERPRHTGMSTARDSKGNWDDKAVAKCHTNARKYFLLALFQVPAGDFDDADAEDANQRKQKAPVPGPSSSATEQEPAGPRPATYAHTVGAGGGGGGVTENIDAGIPHRITLGGGAGPDDWCKAFIRAIGKAATLDELQGWEKANDKVLQNISDNYPGTYDMIVIAVQRRTDDLSSDRSATSSAMPNPKVDPVESLNWVAEQLAQLQSIGAVTAFWNQHVAPHESTFDQMDWDMLLQEFKRTEARVNPPDDEPPEEA